MTASQCHSCDRPSETRGYCSTHYRRRLHTGRYGYRLCAAQVGADELAAADLLAHLRGRLTDPAAYTTARYVLELGWRPTVGIPPQTKGTT